MAEPILLRNLTWAGSTVLELILLMWVVRRRMYRTHPFPVYIFSTVAINFSLFERWLRAYINLRNFLDILTFLATLLIWTKPARGYSISPEVASQPAMTPGGMTKDAYSSISQELNHKLISLNKWLKCLSGLGDR